MGHQEIYVLYLYKEIHTEMNFQYCVSSIIIMKFVDSAISRHFAALVIPDHKLTG